MLFNSLEFLLVFLPVTLLLFYAVPVPARAAVLVLASSLFYLVSGWLPFVFMVLTVVWVWALVFLQDRPRYRKAAIWSVVIGPLCVLFLFKYLNFTLASLDALHAAVLGKWGVGAVGSLVAWVRTHAFAILAITLPAGISFYTFQVLSYGVDVHRGQAPVERSFSMLYLYVAFFPHLIAGPIMRYDQLVPQLKRITREKVISPDFNQGVALLTLGLMGKMFFADLPSTFLEDIKESKFAVSADALFYILVRTNQIYFDFWGYSLMAIGLGKLFAVELAKNFNEPYNAPNPQEFWRRWHITLATWMRDYIYISIGGRRQYVRNTVIVFALVGLWHGAGWNFVAWGLWHGLMLAAYHVLKRQWDSLPVWAGTAVTLVLAACAWPLFFLSIEEYGRLMWALLAFNGTGSAVSAGKWGYVVGILVFVLAGREKYWVYAQPQRLRHARAFALGLVFVSSLLFFQSSQTFIYFRF